MDFKIQWIGTDGAFYAHRRDAAGRIWTPEIHVIHIMDGKLSGTDTWFNSKNVSASTHYGIGRDGEIHQYVSDEHAAWGNGLCTNYTWYGYQKYPGVNPNLYTLSYELEGYSGDVPTDVQWEALLYLLQLKSDEYAIPRTEDHYLGHYIIDPINRPGCPGTGFPWDRLYHDLGIGVHTLGVTNSSPVLAFGAEGEGVKYLQERLQQQGYACGIIDGEFGPRTLQAVKEFQRAAGIIDDGIVGSITWSYLVQPLGTR